MGAQQIEVPPSYLSLTLQQEAIHSEGTKWCWAPRQRIQLGPIYIRAQNGVKHEQRLSVCTSITILLLLYM